MKNQTVVVTRSADQAGELRAELARKIALFMGSAEKRVTDVPGLTLVRRTTLAAPACMTYEPSLAVIAQGRKRVDLGRTTFIYDESRFLLTSIDLPIVSRLIEASEEVPFLALGLKLEMPVVRELLNRDEVSVPDAPPDSPAMATGEATAELLSACCRLVDLLNNPRDIPFLSGLIQREIVYRILRGPGAHVFAQLPRWAIRATGPQKPSRGSGRTTPNRCGWKISHRWRAWECPRCTSISVPSPR